MHFLPPYAPHLNPIERFWAVMHMWVTHNQYYATYDEFTAAILKFFENLCLKIGRSSEILLRIISR